MMKEKEVKRILNLYSEIAPISEYIQCCVIEGQWLKINRPKIDALSPQAKKLLLKVLDIPVPDPPKHVLVDLMESEQSYMARYGPFDVLDLLRKV